MCRRFLQVDVFTDRLFAGNPVDANALSSERMQQIARCVAWRAVTGATSGTRFVQESTLRAASRRARSLRMKACPKTRCAAAAYFRSRHEPVADYVARDGFVRVTFRPDGSWIAGHAVVCVDGTIDS